MQAGSILGAPLPDTAARILRPLFFVLVVAAAVAEIICGHAHLDHHGSDVKVARQATPYFPVIPVCPTGLFT